MRKEPKSLSFDEFADELLLEKQPRAIVILGSAQIDTQLRNIIESFIWPKAGKPNEVDELLDGDNPLSTFSSRIKISFRLGLIDERLLNALNKIREIRNQAAHWITFGVSDAPLRDQLKHLNAIITNRRSYSLTVSRFFTEEQKLNELETLQAMLLTLSAILGSIESRIHSKSLSTTYIQFNLD